jgi:hypothetical protein
MPLSPTIKAAMFSQETDEVIIALISVMHPDVPTTVLGRVSSDPTLQVSVDPLLYGTISRGQAYWFIPFQLTLPEIAEDTPPTAKLVIDNVEREFVALLRSVTRPPLLLIELVLASSPDYVEMSLGNLKILQFENTAKSIVMTLGYQSLTTEPFPAGSFVPAQFPGLFR